MRPRIDERTVHVDCSVGLLTADLLLPATPTGLVLFVHGSGSSRLSPRNREVARALARRGLATMLLDLLTPTEELEDARTRELRFDIALLTERVMSALEWIARDETLRTLPLGLFGASTGAAAALAAAAREPDRIAAIVSRGGRPDLTGSSLASVQAPTLLVVGSRDIQVLRLNEQAAARMRCAHELSIVQGATHLFAEPGALEQVTQRAGDWFVQHLAPPRHRGPFADRTQAGRELAQALEGRMATLHDPLVLALPRGGIPVAIPVARMLHAPLDVVVARKIGTPLQPELALGAVDEDGTALVDEDLRQRVRVSREQLGDLAHRAHEQASARATLLRYGRALPDVRDRDVVLVDDGIATGMTARVAAGFLHRHGARRVVLAVPVAPLDLVLDPPAEFDAVVCPYAPAGFGSVGQHYRRFEQLGDEQVRTMLRAVLTTPA